MAIVTEVEKEVDIICPICGNKFRTKIMQQYYDD